MAAPRFTGGWTPRTWRRRVDFRWLAAATASRRAAEALDLRVGVATLNAFNAPRSAGSPVILRLAALLFARRCRYRLGRALLGELPPRPPRPIAAGVTAQVICDRCHPAPLGWSVPLAAGGFGIQVDVSLYRVAPAALKYARCRLTQAPLKTPAGCCAGTAPILNLRDPDARCCAPPFFADRLPCPVADRNVDRPAVDARPGCRYLAVPQSAYDDITARGLLAPAISLPSWSGCFRSSAGRGVRDLRERTATFCPRPLARVGLSGLRP